MTSQADNPAPATPVPAPPLGPLRRVWLRYLKARGARAGLILVTAFTVLAFFAPFLAHRLPFRWQDGAGGAVTYPLIREFFAPSDTTEPQLEKGINFLMLFIPLAVLAWWAMNRWLPRLGRFESRLISLLFGLMFAASLWLALGGMVVAGAGKDWFHYENPPVPEMDDIVAPRAATPSATPAGGVARNALASALSGLAEAAEKPGDDDTVRRRILPLLQKAIESPPPVPVSAVTSADPAFDPAGLTDANLAVGINAARWNRMLVEIAYPGLLAPMRNFRTTFVSLAIVCLLTLLGLSYIFLAGANQFALSPRWLVLLLLAAVLALPFRHPPRHDHAPYRELAAEGKGEGIFPPIPYGPNEQGFGPRLPPSWHVKQPQFTPASVLSWAHFADALANPERPGTRRAAELLAQAIPGWRKQIADEAGRARVVDALNRMLDNPDLLVPEETERLRSDLFLGPYAAELLAGRPLSPVNQQRFNRLLLEKAVPYAFEPAPAAQWKKPRNIAGYHLLGTDESGRDVLVRIIHGARVSLSVGFVSVFLATVIGLVMGSLAAYYGGRVDMLISRFLEIMMCFPSFFLILAVIAVLDKRSIVNIMLVIGLTSWTGVARLIRGEMLRQKKMDYVWASIALGASDTRTIFRQILPNAMAPVLVSISFGITGAILTEAGLSFIGFGVTPPTPTWGQLLSETRDSPLANWWLAVFPGIVLFFSVLAYNMVGEAMRDALDPRTTL